VLRRNFSARVGQEFEGQSFFRAKFLVRIGAVHAYAKNYCSGLVVLGEVSLKIMRLEGATAGHVLWIKIENDPFALEVLETDLRSVTGGQRKVRRGGAGGRLSLCVCASHQSNCSEANDC